GLLWRGPRCSVGRKGRGRRRRQRPRASGALCPRTVSPLEGTHVDGHEKDGEGRHNVGVVDARGDRARSIVTRGRNTPEMRWSLLSHGNANTPETEKSNIC